MPALPAKKKKKGLSLEEKILLVEKWITAHPQPYTMKELQQLIPKQTHVIYQSVEECVQLLVAENRVQQDRVGVSTLFWKFPLTETQKLNPNARNPQSGGSGIGSNNGEGRLTYAELLRRLTCSSSGDASLSPAAVERLCASVAPRELHEWRAMLQAEHAKLDHCLENELTRVGFAEEESVQDEVSRLQTLMVRRAQLVAQQKALSSFQSLPEWLRRLDSATVVAVEAANRWTDNYYLAEMEVVARSGQSQRDVRAALRIPLNIDFISDDDNDDDNKTEGKEGREKETAMGEEEVLTGSVGTCASFIMKAKATTNADGKPSNSLLTPAPNSESAQVAPAAAAEEETSLSVLTARPYADQTAHATTLDSEATDASASLNEEAASNALVDVPPADTSRGKPKKPAPKKRNARKRAR